MPPHVGSPQKVAAYGAINSGHDVEIARSQAHVSTTPLLVKAGRKAGKIIHDLDIHMEDDFRVYEKTFDTNDANNVLEHEGEATVASEVVNIMKNLIGTGVLSLSGGIALFSSTPRHAIPTAILSVALMGALSGYFCLLIAKVCKITHSVTYRDCWESTMGKRGGLAVAIINTLNPAFGNLAYSAVLSQTFRSLFQTIGYEFNRVESLLIITFTIILPLCLLKNLNALAPFSAFGTAGIFLTAGAMFLRYWEGSYLPGGLYYDDLAPELRPQFDFESKEVAVLRHPLTVLPFLCMCMEAFVMHYNSPRFYTELREATIPKFTGVLGSSFGLSGVIYICIALAGFMTFGGACDGYILNNYSPQDPLATLCRIAIAFSVLMTYPICFIGFRDGVLDMLHIPPEDQTDFGLNALTLFLLACVTTTACFVTDFGVINALGEFVYI
jgi:amino acid permease